MPAILTVDDSRTVRAIVSTQNQGEIGGCVGKRSSVVRPAARLQSTFPGYAGPD